MTQIKIESFAFSDKERFNKALAIRTTVFVEEQNVPVELEYDEYESNSRHFLLYFQKTPVAASRYRITDEGIKLERFAVLKKYRGKGFAAGLLKHMLEIHKKSNQTIYLYAQINAVGFYEKYGFSTVGNSFIEAGIVHYNMLYTK